MTESQDPLPLPKPDCSDFAAYLGYLHASEPRIIREAERRLREGILEGFFSFKAEPFGDASIIRCLFEGSDGSDIIFRLDELSAGQIAAVVLHVATASVERSGGCLILDEPGNFLSVSELQPFMSLWQRLALESGRQVIMATHHPIAIDFLAGAHGLWFERSPIGPARNPVPLKVAEDATRERSYLRISDLIARGWLSGIGVETPSA